MIQRNFKLALTAGRTIPLVIPASQYDSGEQWIFTLIDETGAKYTPATGAIIGLKSDKTAILNAGTVDAAGRVVINETEQMTAAIGKNVYEILIDDQTHGSANFIVMVEPRPGDQADFSDSDLSLLEQAIQGTSETAIKAGVSEWMTENMTGTSPAVDSSLSITGAAADAKKTGDEISDLKSALDDIEEQIEGGTGDGLTSAIKSALLQLAQKVAYIDDDGQTYYDNLYDALYPAIEYTAITLNKSSLSFGSLNTTQTLVATTTPRGGNVTWSSSNTSVATVSQTGVVTSVGYGNATITATCGSLTATCSVAIAQATVTRISAVFSQVGVTVYDTDTLDSLKSHLTVTAEYSNGSSSRVADSDYTLSGTLEEGTSTITVSYGGQSTTFNVTVTHIRTIDYTDGYINDNGEIVSATNNYVSNNYDTVTAGDFVQIQNFSPASSVRVAEYDSSKNFIKRSYQTQNELHSGQSYKLADNTAFVRMGFITSSPNDSFADYVVCDAPTNLDYYVGKDIDTSTGELQDNANRAVTDFIPASGTAIGIGVNSTTALYYTARCYDSNKNFLGSATVAGLSSAGTQTVTGEAKTLVSNTAFVRITLGLNQMGSVTMTNVCDDCDFAVGFSDSSANKLFKLVSAS